MKTKKRVIAGILVLVMLLSSVVDGSTFRKVSAAEVGAGGSGEDYVAPVAKNLLTNGNLEDGLTGWDYYNQGATITHQPYKAVFNVEQNAADWQISLYQNVSKIETGTKYLISFDILSSVDRTVIFGFDGNRDFKSDVIPAGVKPTVNCEVTAAPQKFMIYLGTDVGAHTVEVSNIVLLEKPEDLPDDENDVLPDAITNLDGLDLSKGTLLTNGSFSLGSNGLEGWKTDAVEWMTTWNVVRYSKVADGLKVWITNVGDGAGNIPQDAKFYQNVKLAANKTYTISFDVYSEKARSIQISLDGRKNILSKTIAIQK
ncbi:carbohydrate binding domain-containing protein, partial [Anaerosporobacter sp.]|uniref:carbohydrate binding domain-containing protein n=1 Tax=Anaerosporobacter sp. TaxID=1872529 RepID=UPI00286EDBE4